MKDTYGGPSVLAPAEAEVRAVIARYERAVRSGDPALAVSCYAEDALMMAAAQPTVEGPDLLAAFTEGFAVFRLDVEFTIDELVVASDTIAYALTRSSGAMVMQATGERHPELNRELFVFGVERGEWKIKRYLFNQPA